MFSDVRGDFMAEIMVYCFLSSSSLSADNTSKLGQMGSWMSGDELEQVAASGESTGVSRDTCQSTTYCPPTSSLIISKTNSLKEHVIPLLYVHLWKCCQRKIKVEILQKGFYAWLRWKKLLCQQKQNATKCFGNTLGQQVMMYCK